jgi:hypothetical protein
MFSSGVSSAAGAACEGMAIIDSQAKSKSVKRERIPLGRKLMARR